MGNCTLDSQTKLELMFNKVKLFLKCVIWIQIRDLQQRNIKTGNKS